MRMLRSILAGLRALWRGDQIRRDIEDELRDFQQRQTNDFMEQGLSWAEAERTARTVIGSLSARGEEVRSAVARTQYLPLDPSGTRSGFRDGSDIVTINHHRVSREYFATTGIDLIWGRTFSDREIAAASPVAVINESLARKRGRPEEVLGTSLGRIHHDLERLTRFNRCPPRRAAFRCRCVRRQRVRRASALA